MTAQNARTILGIPPSVPTVSDSVLVLIDTQGEYATGLLKVAHIAETRKVIKSLLDRYRAGGGKVIHVVADTPPGAPIFTPGTPLAAILEELTPLQNEPVVHKTHASAFSASDFKEEVDKTDKKKLVVVGYMVHNCVTATIHSGAALGYDVYAVRDAVSDRDLPTATAEEVVRVGLAGVADIVATIIESKDIV